MKLTSLQLNQAAEMNNQGITWTIIAAYFKTTTTKLRTQLKHYEQSNNRIHPTYETS